MLHLQIKDDTNRWRDIPCSWIGRVNIVKKIISPKAIYRFNAIPVKLPMTFFIEQQQQNILCMRTQKNPNSQEILRRKRSREISLLFLRLYHTTTIIKPIWYWQKYKNRNINQWNKIESPEIMPCTYGHLIYDNEARIYTGEKIVSSIKWCWWNWKAMYKRMKWEHSLTPYTKINSKWIKDLNIRPENIKILEENIGKKVFHINYSKIFYDPPMNIKININK